MIKVKNLLKMLKKNGINFYTGVPDSILEFFHKVRNIGEKNHIIANNEGSAISLRIGHYLSTQKYLLYMQNSGLSNASILNF